jgi:geranylgeranyl diphosphate synthase type II
LGFLDRVFFDYAPETYLWSRGSNLEQLGARNREILLLSKNVLISRQGDVIDLRLEKLLPPSCADVLVDAVRAACGGRNKRVRPTLAMLSAAHFGGCEMSALDFGCALEMIHTASLVLDDLPCMDDATMRRGQPALHRRFGEDAAVLSAVALLNQAYAVIAADEALEAATRLWLTGLVSRAVGFGGLVSGQIRDLRDPLSVRDEAALTSLNHQKTGVLFVAAVEGGAMIAGADSAARDRARTFADRLGFAFQLCDDLLDSTASEAILGKDVLQDQGRITFLSLWGEARTRAAMDAVVEDAIAALGARDCPLAAYALSLLPRV